jgi:hypothetical protein
MTENEAKAFLEIEKQCINRNCDRNCAKCDIVQKVEDLNSAYDTAIKALKEVQQYRQIGTVEECLKNKDFLDFLSDKMNPNDFETYLRLYNALEEKGCDADGKN